MDIRSENTTKTKSKVLKLYPSKASSKFPKIQQKYFYIIDKYVFLPLCRQRVHPDSIKSKIHSNTINNTKYPIWSAMEFKLAVFTVLPNIWACSVTHDPCQPTKFKGYSRVFIYVGAGHLIYNVNALKLLRIYQWEG